MFDLEGILAQFQISIIPIEYGQTAPTVFLPLVYRLLHQEHSTDTTRATMD